MDKLLNCTFLTGQGQKTKLLGLLLLLLLMYQRLNVYSAEDEGILL